MATEKPVREPLPSHEFTTANQSIALQTRLLLGGEALRPNKKDLVKVEADQLPNRHQQTRESTLTKMSNASTFERDRYWSRKAGAEPQLENFDAQFNTWVSSTVSSFEDQNNRDVTQRLGSLTLGSGADRINLTNFNTQEAGKLYRRYFQTDQENSQKVVLRKPTVEELAVPSHIKRFVDDVIGSYKTGDKINFEKLKTDLPAITWLARIFGDNSKELVTELIEAEVKLQDAEERKRLVDQANESSSVPTDVGTTADKEKITRLNWLNPREERLLAFLEGYGDLERRDVTKRPQPPTPPARPTPQPPVSPPPPRPTIRQQEQEKGIKTLEDRFRAVVGNPDQTQKYFVANPPDRLEIQDNELNKYELRLPFFTDITLIDNKPAFSTNQNVVPYVWYLLDEKNDARFKNAEASTNGDSGLFALAASSAENPEKQARMYRALADTILKIHERSFADSGRPTLFDRWYGAQQQAGRWDDPNIIDSLSVFDYFDHDPRTHSLKPENERLLIHDDKTGRLDSMNIGFWQQRTAELRQALNSDRLEPHHLRWLEFLSHSVNVAELVKSMQEKQPMEIKVDFLVTSKTGEPPISLAQ